MKLPFSSVWMKFRFLDFWGEVPVPGSVPCTGWSWIDVRSEVQIFRYPDAQKPRCPEAQMPRCPDAQMPGCPDAQMPRRTLIQDHPVMPILFFFSFFQGHWKRQETSHSGTYHVPLRTIHNSTGKISVRIDSPEIKKIPKMCSNHPKISYRYQLIYSILLKMMK